MSRKILGLIIALLILISAPASWAADCKAVYDDGAAKFSLATGSPGELGLLKELANAFNQKNNSSMCWTKAGSGKSLKLLKAKQVDLVMVHAPAAEKKAIKDGWAIKRTLIGSNEFYIVGPKSDPAGIKTAQTAPQAYALIAKAKINFISRGDNSGTNKKELAIWAKAGIKPDGKWYIITKDFMMASLKKADQVGGYFMTDSSTWIKGKAGLANSAVLFRGDPFLINTYHALAQPAGATPAAGLAVKFIDFVSSNAGQKLISDFGKADFGESLYNNAEYAKQYDH